MDIALVLILASACAIGVTSAVVRTWSLHSRIYSLEDRVAILEGTMQREVKSRAATERWRKPDKDEALAKELMGASTAGKRPLNWWENPAVKKGAHVP